MAALRIVDPFMIKQVLKIDKNSFPSLGLNLIKLHLSGIFQTAFNNLRAIHRCGRRQIQQAQSIILNSLFIGIYN